MPIFTCRYCPSSFTSTRKLETYQKQHRSQRCKICNKAFYQTSQLVEHVYTHVVTPPKTAEAGIQCELINFNTMRIEYRERQPKEDSLSTYGLTTPEKLPFGF